MKVSNFVVEQSVDDNVGILYSTVTRKYYMYSVDKQEYVRGLLKNLNKENYTLDEVDIIKRLYSLGIIIDDNLDEIEFLRNEENKKRYQDSILRMTIFLTKACNFRCTYCIQEHVNKRIDDETIDNIIQFIVKESEKRREIKINWFGGEPLLEYEVLTNILKKVLPVCKEKGCTLNSSMTTNGYLLDEHKVTVLRDLGVKTLQITVDGDKNNHNKTRVLPNGEGTYDRVLKGVELAAGNGIKVILRININSENIDAKPQVLEDIEKSLRENIYISICNVFQEEEKHSSFEIKKYACELGYKRCGRFNNFYGCQACGYNSVTIAPDGKLLFCSNAENTEPIGSFKQSGHIMYKNKQMHSQNISKSLVDNDECRSCKELPLCIGGCKYANLLNGNKKCRGKRPDGLSIEEVAYLDYYEDLLNNKEA